VTERLADVIGQVEEAVLDAAAYAPGSRGGYRPLATVSNPAASTSGPDARWSATAGCFAAAAGSSGAPQPASNWSGARTGADASAPPQPPSRAAWRANGFGADSFRPDGFGAAGSRADLSGGRDRGAAGSLAGVWGVGDRGAAWAGAAGRPAAGSSEGDVQTPPIPSEPGAEVAARVLGRHHPLTVVMAAAARPRGFAPARTAAQAALVLGVEHSVTRMLDERLRSCRRTGPNTPHPPIAPPTPSGPTPLP
jgi:hypothetical protein